MLARARRRCPTLSAGGRLYRMDVTALEFPAASFDAAVATFLFCVLPESQQVPALWELDRVVRPGGLIRLLEYVRPRGTLRRIGRPAGAQVLFRCSKTQDSRATPGRPARFGQSTIPSRSMAARSLAGSSPRMPGICCWPGSLIPDARDGLLRPSSAQLAFPDGGCGRSGFRRYAIIRCRIITARYGRTTTR